MTVILASGTVAAVALGKFSPFLDRVREGFDLSLTNAGWLTSGITVVAAAAATPVGRWAGATRARSVLALGLVATGLSGLAMSAFADMAWQLFALRLLEAVGYVAIMVTGPSLLAQVADAHLRSWALALWGMCIPGGLAAAAAAGGLMAGAGWRAWIAVPAVAAILLAVAVRWAVPLWTGQDGTAAAAAVPSTGRISGSVWSLASGFALVSMVGLATVTLLPTFLSTERGLPEGRSGALTSVVAAASILGSVAAGLLVRRGVRHTSLFASALAMPLLGAGVFLGPTWPWCFVAATLLMVVNGIVVAGVFSALPSVAGVSGAGRATGMVTQMGSVGTLMGPPLFGASKDLVGWWAVLPLTAAAALTGVAALSVAVRRETVTSEA